MTLARTLVLVAALALPAAFAGWASGSVAATEGLYGEVTMSPARPGCSSCEQPLAGARLAFLRDGEVVASVRTNEEGGYRVALSAGTYSVALQRQRPDVRKNPDQRRRAVRRAKSRRPVVRRTIRPGRVARTTPRNLQVPLLGRLTPRTVAVPKGSFKQVDFTLELGNR